MQAMARNFHNRRQRPLTHKQLQEIGYRRFIDLMYVRLPQEMIYYIRELVLEASPCREYILLWESTPMLY